MFPRSSLRNGRDTGFGLVSLQHGSTSSSPKGFAGSRANQDRNRDATPCAWWVLLSLNQVTLGVKARKLLRFVVAGSQASLADFGGSSESQLECWYALPGTDKQMAFKSMSRCNLVSPESTIGSLLVVMSSIGLMAKALVVIATQFRIITSRPRIGRALWLRAVRSTLKTRFTKSALPWPVSRALCCRPRKRDHGGSSE